MRSFLRFTVLLLVLAFTAFAEDAASPTPKPAKVPEGEFDIPVPEGMPVKGIKIPHRDRDGKLIMVLEADVAKKLDASRIEMDELKIDAYDSEGKKIFVQVAHSIFNLETRILSGDTRTLIKRDDFEITGDSVEFDTRTRNGTLRGNIKMTIQSADIAP